MFIVDLLGEHDELVINALITEYQQEQLSDEMTQSESEEDLKFNA